MFPNKYSDGLGFGHSLLDFILKTHSGQHLFRIEPAVYATILQLTGHGSNEFLVLAIVRQEQVEIAYCDLAL